jgi:hypothetical protein
VFRTASSRCAVTVLADFASLVFARNTGADQGFTAYDPAPADSDGAGDLLGSDQR